MKIGIILMVVAIFCWLVLSFISIAVGKNKHLEFFEIPFKEWFVNDTGQTLFRITLLLTIALSFIGYMTTVVNIPYIVKLEPEVKLAYEMFLSIIGIPAVYILFGIGKLLAAAIYYGIPLSIGAIGCLIDYISGRD